MKRGEARAIAAAAKIAEISGGVIRADGSGWMVPAGKEVPFLLGDSPPAEPEARDQPTDLNPPQDTSPRRWWQFWRKE